MTKKQLKSFAKKIAEYETIIQNTNDENAKREAEQEVMKITNILGFEDMMEIDDMVLKILSKNN